MQTDGSIRAIGEETLRRMQSVERYNNWIHETLAPLVGRRVLEIGCGIGNMTSYFVAGREFVSIDTNPSAVESVRETFRDHPGFTAYEGDICDEALVKRLQGYGFDTVLCINVLEHIKDDGAALRNMNRLLKPAGRLLLFVPAGVYLYGTLDRALGHHRRYERRSLRRLLEREGFQLERLSYMNLAGIPGWFLNSRVLRRRVLSRRMLKLFNVLTPLFIALESVLKPPIGQSLLCVAIKPDKVPAT